MFFRRGGVSLFLLWMIFSAKLLTEIQILPRFLNKIFENSRAEKEKRSPCGKASRKLSGKLSRQHYPCTRSFSMDTAMLCNSFSINYDSLFTFGYALVNTRDSISKTLYTILKGLAFDLIIEYQADTN